MALILILLVAALVLPLLAPIALTVGHWQVRHPRTALALWFGAFFAGFAALAGSLIAIIVAALGASAGKPAAEAFAVTVLAWLSLGAVGGALTVIAAASEPILEADREVVQQFAPVVTSRELRGRLVMAKFHGTEPVACTVGGKEPMILVSSALEQALTPAEVQAVLAHEYAHLHGRHHWALRIARVNSACLPRGLAAGPALTRATLLLVELSADDSAARQAGAVNVANALAKLSRLTRNSGMQLRAERLTLKRWPARRRLPELIRLAH